MTKLETMRNDQMTKRCRSCISGFWLRHSFVIRHSCFAAYKPRRTRAAAQCLRGFVICLFVFTAGTTAFAQKRNITEKDLWDFVWIGDPQVSPDGSRVAFVRVTVNEKKEGYNTSIWSLPMSGSEEPHQLTKGDDDQATMNAAAESEHVSDIRVITRAVYREDNEGYADLKHPGHIWTIQAPRNADEKVLPKQVTFGRFDEGNIVWSKDGAQIYFVSLHVDETYYEQPKSELYSISLNGGTATKLNTIDMDVGGLSLSPDGKQLAFVASVTQPVNSYTQPDLWIVDLTPNAKPRNLTEKFDFDIDDGPFGDNAPPRAGGRSIPIWTPDGRSLVETYGKEGKAILASFDATTGAVSDLVNGNQAISRFRAPNDGSKVVYTVTTPTRVGDLFVLDRQSPNSQPRKLTDVNKELFSKLNLTEPDEISYKSFDGKTIQAWVQKPPDFNAAKKYPLILNIHGGPHAAYGYIFEHEFQWMAAKGYVVLFPNPRGSTTYGQDFGNVIQYHYPGDDFKDLMPGVDELVRRGYIDEKKLGVTGGSGGGLLTNWVVGHTTRFAAAVAQRDIASWTHWWYTADFTLFQPAWFKIGRASCRERV